ncbi:ShlB/FhaC/HecB family hemolysin secretion/activation protein [Acidiphilium sp.]|uniref:ShlB/FhaC/HecB family hemolysin secretion/activation protein n=1 Tax=Acidiphilium sp. TaxID=527 RepID=UPI003CFC00B8
MQAIQLQTFTPTAMPRTVIERRLPAAAGAPIRVQSNGYDYVVTGNTLLPAARIRTELASATGPAEAAQRLLALYRRLGHVMIGIRVLTSSNHVTIAVVEGRIVDVREQASGLAAFYRGVAFDPTVTNDQLLRRNVMADAYASASGLDFRPNLRPAPQPGGSDLVLDAAQHPGFESLSGSALLGNYGNRYTGGVVLGENLQLQPGHGTVFALNYAHGLPELTNASRGSRYDGAGASAAVITPYGKYTLAWAGARYRVGAAGAPLYPEGSTEAWTLSGERLLAATPTARFGVNGALAHVHVASDVYGGAYVLTDQDYNVASLGFRVAKNVVAFGRQASVSATATATLGLSAPRGTLAISQPGAPESRFRYINLGLNWDQPLTAGWSLSLSTSGQWSWSSLPQNQQWVLGGIGSLSAWSPAIIVGDSGILNRAVLQSPTRSLGRWTASAQAFVEQGAAASRYTPPSTPAWTGLADAGLGVSLQWRRTQLSLVAATRIDSHNLTQADRNGRRALYVVLQQGF